ncbi:phospholipase A and acyltransferase 4 isoform X1 [Astyanax mexicanus]|uniref:Retinoic acid receptor responder protein 3-like n=2 Tax=Astyanax mexicanus TaxID=7994 RepID=A0A8B9KT48_ASTMX|nr:phospholipase A and acyltransferase 4 isoform X1 [Astyanax mexicanus]KAG9272468.1 retinoic acid receptor responder protein 3-like isoform X1 [Astyanax mexicanus]
MFGLSDTETDTDHSRALAVSAGVRQSSDSDCKQNQKNITNRSPRMAPSQLDKKPEPGDLIEIYRGTYQHWAIYIGDGYVIHLAPPSEHAQAGAYSMMSVLCDKAVVKKEQLWDVVGDDMYTINNLLDHKYEPRPVQDILRDAHSLLYRELPYCVFRGNCEHFATELRYGKAESRQVRKAVEVGVGVGVAAMIGFGVLAVATSIFGSENKEKKSTQ